MAAICGVTRTPKKTRTKNKSLLDFDNQYDRIVDEMVDFVSSTIQLTGGERGDFK